MNILLVEDKTLSEDYLSESVALFFPHAVTTADNPGDALRIARNGAIDVCVFETNTRWHQNGVRTAVKLREEYDIPSLFVTTCKAHTKIKDAMRAAPLGYLIKPIQNEEIRAALMIAETQIRQKRNARPAAIRRIGGYAYNPVTRMLTHKGAPVLLTQKETECLHHLFLHADTIIGYEQLHALLWKDGEKSITSLRELVFRLRKKLSGLTIKNVHSSGYMLQR